MYYRGCWHIVSHDFLIGYRQYRNISFPIFSFPITGVYRPKSVILHVVLLHQTFVHCEKFPTAASRRSMGRVSVPLWPINLSVRLCIIALVSFYLTNKLMQYVPILKRCKRIFQHLKMPKNILSGISHRFQ